MIPIFQRGTKCSKVMSVRSAASVEPTVFDNHLLQACVQQQQMLEQMVKPPNITLDREALADAVQVFANHADLLERTQRRLLFKAGRVNHPESKAIGSQIASLIEAAIARGNLLNQAGDAAIGNDRSSQLSKSLQRLEQLGVLHSKTWPQERLPTPDEVAEADRRGETLDLDEAFADMLNLDADSWSDLVAKHRRVKEPRSVVDA